MPLPRSFYFLRHGETDWNRVRRIQGWTDTPLNETGIAQARAAYEKIKHLPIDRILSSTLTRAATTAEIVNDGLRKPILFDARLRERQYGVFEGKAAAEFDTWRIEATKKFPDQVEECGYPCQEGAEPYAIFKERVVASLAEHMAAFPGENLLIVAHGGVCRALNRALQTALGHSPNAVPYFFGKTDGKWELREIRGLKTI